MPYVTRERRIELAMGATMQNAGDLAFMLTSEVERFLRDKPLRYEQIAMVLAALESTKDAFNEDVVRPYEARKRRENGAIFPPPRFTPVERRPESDSKPAEEPKVGAHQECTPSSEEPAREASGASRGHKVHVAETPQSMFCDMCGKSLRLARIHGEEVVVAGSREWEQKHAVA